MKLVIVESPSKAKTIVKYLGQGYRVIASGGHVSDLPQKSLGIDVNNNYKPEYVVTPSKEETIRRIKSELAKCDKVYLATDPDREGEAISWHLANVCGIKDKNVRIVFNEISKKAVNAAIENPHSINMNLVNAQQARRVLDRLVGYELSPVISRKVKGAMSAGRVQSVALKMIVEREREIRNFKPEEYWNIYAFLLQEGKSAVFKAEFVEVDGKKYKVKNKDVAEKIVKASKEGEWSVDKVKRVNSQSKPQPPFTTSTMQQDASGKLSLTAPQVMQLAQQLYEGVELGSEGQVALVTYIRTDSVRISTDAQREALEFIKNAYGESYVPKRPNVYETKKGAQDAHEAIRPISLERTPESIKDKVPRNIYKLYKLIYDRFVASQMANAVYDTLNVHINSLNPNGHTCGYTLKGRTLVFKGYLAAYTPVSDNEEEKDSKTLPDFREGQKLNLKEMQSEQKFTKPPLRYTDSTLVKAMEENGIGRPSTYAATITVLAKRKYTDKEGKYILPTELGELACDCLCKYFPYIMDVKFTSNMESDLDKIEDGTTEWQPVIADFYPGFHERVLKARGDNAGKVKPKEEVSDVVCEKCGAKMVVKEGRFGKFLACPNYPKCKNIKPIGEPVAKCPKCGGDVFKRISKKGKAYFACGNYPKCDFYSWDIPAPIFCPDCGSYMKMFKDKSGNTKYVCSNKECKHTEVIQSESSKDGGDEN